MKYDFWVFVHTLRQLIVNIFLYEKTLIKTLKKISYTKEVFHHRKDYLSKALQCAEIRFELIWKLVFIGITEVFVNT